MYRIVDEELSNPQVLVVRNTPRTLANKFSIERYWKDSRGQTKTLDRKEVNRGCIQKLGRTYQCSRDVAQEGKFIAESIYWNSKNDLVLIRVTSLNSFSKARAVLENIKITQNTRLPAGVSR